MKRLFISILFILGTMGSSVTAQPPGGGPGNGNPPDHAAPIGGIEILLLGGIALGIKKLTGKKDK